MVIVIPMMGIGNRFSTQGYNEYKPFVKVNGVPLLRLVVEPLLSCPVYIVCNPEVAKQVRSLFSDEVNIIELNNPTKGAADTMLQAAKYLPPSEQISCVDCDTIFNEVTVKHATKMKGNFTLIFTDADRTGMYSYVEVNEEGRVLRIVEKNAISSLANAGWYCFENKELLSHYCSEAVTKSEKEPYISTAIHYAMEDNLPFYSTNIGREFDCCGTPAQLTSYARRTAKKRTICFDIDGTLVYDLHNNQRPIKKNVEYCNELYKNGHRIILSTSRGMISKNENQEAIEQTRPFIETVLQKCGVLYHELRLLKPYADLYIDDKAVPANHNLEKACGIYISTHHASRAHNKITVDGNKIIKTGDVSGECYYYKNISDEIKLFFPNVISCSRSELVLEKINTPTYSSLLLSKRLKKHDITCLINTIHTIHASKTPTERIDLSWAYTHKVRERFDNNKELYNTLGITIPQEVPKQYEFGTIHGDPVFTNVFSAEDDYCKLIDMRGSWDNKQTIHGDIYYDYAKILQSLFGYDYALHNEQIEESYLLSLRAFYIDYIKEFVDIEDLFLKTKLLMVSMLPLHKEDLERCRRFIKLIENVKTIPAGLHQ